MSKNNVKLVQSAADVQSIAIKLGLKFIPITDPQHDIPRNGFSTGDPDTVYLFAPKFKFHVSPNIKPIDANLYWKGRTRSISWGERTSASIRKVLIEDDTSECIVCREEFGILLSTVCPCCNTRCCHRCMVKMSMKDEDAFRILEGDRVIHHKCPGCRQKIHSDIIKIYYRVLDKLDDFTKLQKAALLSVKNNDPEFAITMKQHQQRIQSFRKMALKQLKPGKIVQLVGLKKKEWNGKKAKIIGNQVLKSDMIKWPVELINDSKNKALIKQCNLQKLD